MKFEQLVKDIEENQWDVIGLEVYRKGQLLHSYGDTTEQIYDIYSATKSIVSIAVGICYDRGLIDFEKSILEYLPKDKVGRMSLEQKNDFQKLTIYRLLTMSVEGFPFRPEGDSYLEFCLSYKIENPDNVGFHYSNVCTYLIGVALTEILGEDLGTFIERQILQPLRIKDFIYDRCPDGYFYGASKMKLSVHDLSKFGILMMNDGVFEGQRIVSPEYVRLATSVQIMNREGGYGFFFWNYREGFSVHGKWGQRVYCLPDKDLMVTHLAHMEEQGNELLKSIEKNVLDLK